MGDNPVRKLWRYNMQYVLGVIIIVLALAALFANQVCVMVGGAACR
jgi:hypothetical protein